MGEQMGSKCPELTGRWDTNDFNLSVYFNVCQPLLYVFVGKYPLHDHLAGGGLQLHPSPDEHYFRLLQVGCCSCLAENGLATAGASPSLIFSHQLLQVHLHLGAPLFLWIQLSTLSQNQALSRWQKRPHQVYSTDSWNSLLIDLFVEHFLFTTFLTLFIYVCQMSFWKKLLFREPCLCLKPLALLQTLVCFQTTPRQWLFRFPNSANCCTAENSSGPCLSSLRKVLRKIIPDWQFISSLTPCSSHFCSCFKSGLQDVMRSCCRILWLTCWSTVYSLNWPYG